MSLANALMKKILSALVLAFCIDAPLVLAADAGAEVRKSLEAVIQAGGFRGQVSGNVFGPGTPAVNGDIDAILPDRIHLRSEGLEFIVMPTGAWVSAMGFWTPTDRSLLPVTEFDSSAMRRAIGSVHDAERLGQAKSGRCGDVGVYRFRATGQLPGIDADGDIRIWICMSHGRPARIEATAPSKEKITMDFDWSRKPEVQAPR
jgi:hypothetical protein